MPGRAPKVSVITATYNRSEVLRFAIQSVLAQGFQDFELLVIGDGCSDDSESVTRSFNDPRVRWENLPQNVGSQWGPNNRGLELARGQYVAYLGHDDLWHADHLTVLVQAIETHQCDLVYSMTEDVGPPSKPSRRIMGVAPGGSHEWSLFAPPSSWLHRRDIIERVGRWRDHRQIPLPVDMDLLCRIHDGGLQIVPVAELTVFKFTSVLRSNSYTEHRSDEQAAWWVRMQKEPELRYYELLAVLTELAGRFPELATRLTPPDQVAPGLLAQNFRLRRGLPAKSALPPDPASFTPLHEDRAILRYLNTSGDIVPEEYLDALERETHLPEDGLFLGYYWHSLECDSDGQRWRWLDQDAQILITRPSSGPKLLELDLVPGPGIGAEEGRLQLRDVSGEVVAETPVVGRSQVILEVPVESGHGSTFTLTTPDGGRPIQGDPRILNFRVFGISWADQPSDLALSSNMDEDHEVSAMFGRDSDASSADPAPVTPLYEDRTTLRYLNTSGDIVPGEYLDALERETRLPEDGLFLGYSWHSLECDVDGQRWRWLDQDAQILITHPCSGPKLLELDLVPGPGIGAEEGRLQLRDLSGEVVAETTVVGRSRVILEVPVEFGHGSTFTLTTPDGGRPIQDDPRILNFRVFGISWADQPADLALSPNTDEDHEVNATLARDSYAADSGASSAS